MSLLQKGHVTTAAQRTERAIDGNLCALGVSAVRFCSEVNSVLFQYCTERSERNVACLSQHAVTARAGA